jgi:hypothetical protein
MILDECVYPNALTSDGWNFRQVNCYNVKVNEILRKNLQAIEKIYKRTEGTIITHAKKRFLTLPECKSYLHEMNLKPPISEFTVGAIFYESLLCITDTIRTQRM